MSRRVYIETYGCQMNLADTELLSGHLCRHGYQRTGDPGEADVILLNTCAVREHAEERVLGRLSALARFKRRRPEVRIGVAGCMAQHHRERLLERAPCLDFVVGPDAYRRLPELLGGDAFIDVRLDRRETYADIPPERESGVRAWIPVMRGCDKFCSFCIVPYVRGRERSVPLQAVLEHVRAAAAEGCREVVFLGQTVNAYRDGTATLATLLRATSQVEGIARIRFTSSHPADMTQDLIDAMAECPQVCPQVHLPVQSGSDRVLERMQRGYTVARYLELVDRLRRAIPGVALSTDIMVGFPGEDERDFSATCELLRTVRFDSAFLFQYSPREGARSFRWPETVLPEEKARRLREVIRLQEEISAEINQSLVGQATEVLVEGPARRPEGWLAGKNPQYKTVVFRYPRGAPGDLISVRVTEATAHTLVGVAEPATGRAGATGGAASRPVAPAGGFV